MNRPLAARRARAQGLSGRRARSPAAVVERLLAVQAQDWPSARLAIRARSTGVRAVDVDAALGEDLCRGWLMRGTLHLVAREDYPWLLGLTGPTQWTGNARRLRQEGVSEAQADRGVAAIAAALAGDGPRRRAELREAVAAAGCPVAGQAFVHVLFLAALRGVAVQGAVLDGEPAWLHTRDALGAVPSPRLEGDARDRALAELGRRYARGHAPAGPADLARWSGLPRRDATRALHGAEIGPAGRAPAPPPPRLLGMFDPYLLGWDGRDFALEPARAQDAILGGVFRAVVLVDGLVAGTWARARGRVEIEPFAELDPAATAALAREARAVERF